MHGDWEGLRQSVESVIHNQCRKKQRVHVKDYGCPGRLYKSVSGSFPVVVPLAAPTIEFEQASYQVREPSGPDGLEVLNIKVIRKGDLDRTSKIRCSTRDGSAQSGVDYNPKSRVLKFNPG